MSHATISRQPAAIRGAAPARQAMTAAMMDEERAEKEAAANGRILRRLPLHLRQGGIELYAGEEARKGFLALLRHSGLVEKLCRQGLAATKQPV